VIRLSSLLVLLASVALGLPSAAGAFIYWASQDSDAIGRANLDGSGVEPNFINPVPVATGGPYKPSGVAVDSDHVYWAAEHFDAGLEEEGVVGRAGLESSSIEPAFIAGAAHPSGVAADGEHLYWPDDAVVAGHSTIARAHLNGSGVEQAFIGGLGRPCGIAVDSEHIYWNEGSSIGRANLDGTGVNTTFITLTNPGLHGQPACGVAVGGGHIYWGNNGSIGRANLDGSGVSEEFITGTEQACGVAVDGEHVYWVGGDKGSIGRSNLDGSGVVQSFITVAGMFSCAIAADALLPSTTTIEASRRTAVFGEGATFTATVADAASASHIVPTGTVQFEVNGEPEGRPVALGPEGKAVYTPTEPLEVGDEVTAKYLGNRQLGASTSEAAALTVEAAPTGTTLAATPNPGIVGEAVTFTASVVDTKTAIVPSGSVAFTLDGEFLTAVPLDESGHAGIEVTGLKAGDHAVQASFSFLLGGFGFGDFAPSVASVTEHMLNPPPSPPPSHPAPPAPPNSNFALARAVVASNGSISLWENAPEAGTFTATARTRAGYIASAGIASAACSRTRRRCKAPPPAVYGTATTAATGASMIKLLIKPNRPARAAIASGRTLHVSVSVSFQPARGGAPKSTITPLVVKGVRHKSHRR